MAEYRNLPVKPDTADRVQALFEDSTSPFETRDDVVRTLLDSYEHDGQPAKIEIHSYGHEQRTVWPGETETVVFDDGQVDVQR